jgi:putative SOS response-associated peptidase YedK
MCGRYSLLCIDDLGNRFRVHNPMIGARSRFNIRPGTLQPVIVQGAGGRELQLMQWGLLPRGINDRRAALPVTNARAETLAEKPLFRHLLETKRCLIPASGFFEWKRDRAKKIPFSLHLPGRPLFAFAGLFDERPAPGGTVSATYTIITTEPNPLVATIHNRMPAILAREDEERWLAEGPLPAGSTGRMLGPYPAGDMAITRVSNLVNNQSVDDERVVRPLASSPGMQTFLPE